MFKISGELQKRKSAIENAGPGGLVRMFGKRIRLKDTFGSPKRLRLYTPERTFWLFLAQVMSPKCSCREATRGFLGWLYAGRKAMASAGTAAYCKARARLSLGEIKAVNNRVTRGMSRIEGAAGLWHGRSVIVVDGSSVSMPDTGSNQRAWPQPGGAKPGCGFPAIRLVAVFSLFSGALLSVAAGSLHKSERRLFKKLWRFLESGNIVLADRGFCDYASFFLLSARGVDCVMRKHQRRGGRIVRRIGRGDCLVEWSKNGNKPAWLCEEEWRKIPERMIVREIKVEVVIKGFRSKTVTIASSLTDRRAFAAGDFAELYFKRWKAELYLRDIKTVMGMDILNCKSPAMAKKELWMRIIAYNLIRALMLEAALKRGKRAERLSFKGTADTLRRWLPYLSMSGSHSLYRAMLDYIARDEIPLRSGRSEPRARKRRPKKYQLLTKPRGLFQETPHRGRYGRLS